MIAIQRSPSFLAYTYESDEDENNDEDCYSQLCGCQGDIFDDESERGSQSETDETSSLVQSIAVRKREDVLANHRNKKPSVQRRSDGRLVVGISLAVAILVFCEYCFSIWRWGMNTTATNSETDLFPAVDSKSINTTEKFTSVQYGEVWLIRHGEKIPPSQVGSDGSFEEERREKLRAMYELSPKGWKRANHLATLVKQGEWPLFSALFASRPASLREAEDAYPDFVRDATGQSMVKREYQTLMPISEYLHVIRNGNNNSNNENSSYNDYIDSQFSKGEIKAAALEITKTAVEAASVLSGNRHRIVSKRHSESPIVLVSWDHCSLPTLVVRGFGCRSNNTGSVNNVQDPCYRCWADDRFGDVLKLNVSLVTTTTMTTILTNPIEPIIKNASNANTESAKIVSRDFKVSSTILGMQGEAYPIDQYYTQSINPTSSNNNSDDDNDDDDIAGWQNLSTAIPMSIEKSTPCLHSYCTSRPAAKHLVRCSCWDD